MSPRLRKVAPVAALVLLLAAPGGAAAAPQFGTSAGKVAAAGVLGEPEESTSLSLAADNRNVELVSKLRLEIDGVPVDPEQVADVAVYKNTAYLMSWARPVNQTTGICERGGFWAVDISDPSKPKQRAFRRALERNYHGEGAHVITFPDGRDVLAVNNETCVQAPATEPSVGGGFDLWDVSNPDNPQPLVRAAGDYRNLEPDGTSTLVCCSATAPNANAAIAHEYHSVFMWRDGNKVYLVAVDNNEATRTDVDIFDITNPSSPVAVDEFDLDKEFGLFEPGESVFGNAIVNGNPIDTNLHDMVVKTIDGAPTMLASYWDGGYVLLDVSNPAAPQYIGDSSFAGQDKLTGLDKQTGNAHQAEFSHDNKYILAADEDFTRYRADNRVDPGGAKEFKFESWGDPTQGPIFSVETEFDGPTVFVGDGCTAATIPEAPDPAPIAVVERGTCNFQVKVENADSRGYDRVVIFNSNSTSNGCESVLGMTFTGYTGDAVSVFVPRQVGIRLLDAYDPATYTCTPGGVTTPAPAAPRPGLDLQMLAAFDGWGYAHLYRRGTGKLAEVGTPYAIPESLDERYALDFGDLSIHEWATDPDTNLAYAAYYGGGLRVASFGEAGIKEVGRFIDTRGNNFWGIEQFTSNCQRLIAASDRDYGLYIFKYTGPGAPTACPPPAVLTPSAVTPVRDATDPRVSLLSKSRQSLRTLRGSGLKFQIKVDEGARLEVTLSGALTNNKGKRGKVRKLASAKVAAAGAGRTVTVTLRPSASLRRQLRDEKRLSAVLRVRAIDAAGNDTTRTKTLSFR